MGSGRYARLLACLALVCLAASRQTSAQTQITAGVIQGTVADATGAVLPGVTVEVKNVDTNATTTRTTDADGRFVALAVASRAATRSPSRSPGSRRWSRKTSASRSVNR